MSYPRDSVDTAMEWSAVLMMTIAILLAVFLCEGCATTQRVITADVPCVPLVAAAAECIYKNTKGALPPPSP